MSLYTKYRPIDFDNLEGQSFVKNTLKSAIAQNKTVGAYLFCGPRGTGKTSTARIFAKTLNCLNPKDGNPCLECDICKNFMEERLIDIIEIDAASYTGVDNIREIIEKAQFRPTQTKYKVYIIDEVHMLSKGAFNALLKILEEPPEFVKFILATTETNKVPETIISRCQRYDFKRISEIDIKNRLLFIAQSENVKIDEKSLHYIMKNSGGGLRNAISLFEQLIINDEVIFENVIENLGIVNEDITNNFIEKLLNKDKTIIQDLEDLSQQGKNIKLFFKELIFFIKDKLIIDLSQNKDIKDLLIILEKLNKTYSETKNTLDENLTFTIGIIKIISDFDENVIPNISGFKENKPKITEQKIEIKKIEKKEEINPEDVFDIFGEEEFSVNVENNFTSNQIQSNKTELSNTFSKQDLISNLKTIGVKGALTMSILGAETNLYGNNLQIKFKTSFAMSTVNTNENLGFINMALEKMGLESVKVSLSV